MIVLLDTDVLLDVALDRNPFARPATELLNNLQRRSGAAFMAWHSVSNFYYLTRPRLGQAGPLEFLRDLTRFVGVAPTTIRDLEFALGLGLSDFEDALQVASAVACRAQWIITRNTRHYRQSPVPAITPADMLKERLLDV